jgi:hypothetical protein
MNITALISTIALGVSCAVLFLWINHSTGPDAGRGIFLIFGFFAGVGAFVISAAFLVTSFFR